MAAKVLVLLVSALVFANPAFAEDKFFDSDGVRIRYVDEGRGDPIVLIHGNGGRLEAWSDYGVFPAFARDHRVIAFDVRGHGKSAKPHDPAAYGPEMGLDIVRLLDHLGINRAHIIGYSMGAVIAAKLLTTHPDRFITATLSGSSGRFRWTAEDAKQNEQEAAEKERECVSRSQIYRLAPVNGPKPTDEEIRKRSADCFANPHQDRFALAALHRGQKDNVISSAEAAAVKIPTLGIVGELDPWVVQFGELKSLRPDIDLVVLKGATHATTPRQPEFITTIRQFTAKHSAAR
jgi:pimeloyl-ACP methyl ester carboxylesterase